MVYCGRCGNTGHYISSCPEHYNRDGKRISKITEAEKKRSSQNMKQAVENKKGQRWSIEDDVAISEELDEYIKKKASEFGRSENAIYARLIKILDEMGH